MFVKYSLCVIAICKITGFVNACPSFEKVPAVVNGASDILVEIFGDNGRHISIAERICSLTVGSFCSWCCDAPYGSSCRSRGNCGNFVFECLIQNLVGR